MTLRTSILISVLALISATVLGAVVAIDRVIDRAALRSLQDEVVRSRAVFASLATERRAQIMRMTEVIANEPRLKALASSDADRPTIMGVARDLYKALGSDIFVLVDGNGALILDMLAPSEEGADMLANPVISHAFTQGSASGVWADTSSAYEVHAQRMHSGEHTIGALVLGHRIDDPVAASVHEQTGTSVVVLLDGQVVAMSKLPGAYELERSQVTDACKIVQPDAAQPTQVRLGQARFMAIGGRFPAYQGSADLRYVLLRNLDEALAPGRRVTRILYGILAVAVLCAVVMAMALSRRLWRPLDALCAFAERVGHGDWNTRSSVGGFAEVVRLSEAMNRMASELRDSRRNKAEKDRLQSELAIAAHIQTSILPMRTELPGLEIAARMEPANEVGGDYFDVIATDNGGWLGIGDVAGHDLDAGLIMLMAQTSVTTLIEATPEITPSELAITFNRVLYTNLKERLQSDRHMSLCLLRYLQEGQLIVAGAHLEIIYLPAGADECELWDTPGIWMGMIDDIGPMTSDTPYDLQPGDLVVLYTDGLIEARNTAGEMFGLERVMELIQASRDESVQEICQKLLEATRFFGGTQTDDITVLVMRYVGTPSATQPHM